MQDYKKLYNLLIEFLEGKCFRYSIKDLVTSGNRFSQFYILNKKGPNLGFYLERSSFLNYGILNRQSLLSIHRDLLRNFPRVNWEKENEILNNEMMFYDRIYDKLSTQPEVFIVQSSLKSISFNNELKEKEDSSEVTSIQIKTQSGVEMQIFDIKDIPSREDELIPIYKREPDDELPF